MSKFANLFKRKHLVLIMSLPSNSVELAKAAEDAGADAIKVHISVIHAASGTLFGSFSEEKKRLENILNSISIPVGIMPGADTVASIEELNEMAAMGISFFDIYIEHLPLAYLNIQSQKTLNLNSKSKVQSPKSKVLNPKFAFNSTNAVTPDVETWSDTACGVTSAVTPQFALRSGQSANRTNQATITNYPIIEPVPALGVNFSNSVYSLCEMFNMKFIEASVIPHTEYGKPLVFADLIRYKEICSTFKGDVIIPTQKAIKPSDIEFLKIIGVRSLMLGKIVAGDTHKNIYNSIKAFKKVV